MGKILSLDGAITDTSVPTLVTLEGFEAQIRALALRAWWDPSNPAYRTDVSGKCSVSLDRSGNGFDLVQGTAANRPVVTTDYWGQLNGVHRDALVFDGSADLFLQTAGSPFDNTTVWTHAYLIKSAGAAANVPLAPVSTSFHAFYPAGASFNGPSGQITEAVATQNTKVAAVCTYNYPGSGNVAATMDVNGAVVSGSFVPLVGGSNETRPGSAPAQMGALQTAHNFKFNGAISEYLLFKSDLSAVSGAVAMLKAYFAFKYR